MGSLYFLSPPPGQKSSPSRNDLKVLVTRARASHGTITSLGRQSHLDRPTPLLPLPQAVHSPAVLEALRSGSLQADHSRLVPRHPKCQPTWCTTYSNLLALGFDSLLIVSSRIQHADTLQIQRVDRAEFAIHFFYKTSMVYRTRFFNLYEMWIFICCFCLVCITHFDMYVNIVPPSTAIEMSLF